MSADTPYEQVVFYKCKKCGEEYDIDSLKIDDDLKITCPICGGVQGKHKKEWKKFDRGDFFILGFLIGGLLTLFIFDMVIKGII